LERKRSFEEGKEGEREMKVMESRKKKIPVDRGKRRRNVQLRYNNTFLSYLPSIDRISEKCYDLFTSMRFSNSKLIRMNEREQKLLVEREQ
jgi:uncharacterized membrane protein